MQKHAVSTLEGIFADCAFGHMLCGILKAYLLTMQAETCCVESLEGIFADCACGNMLCRVLKAYVPSACLATCCVARRSIGSTSSFRSQYAALIGYMSQWTCNDCTRFTVYGGGTKPVLSNI